MTQFEQKKSGNQVATRDYVTIVIGPQLFGIPVEDVQDVFTPHSITRVPLAPAGVAGVLNLRGRIVTAIDLRHRLAMSPSDGPIAMAVGIEKAGESYGLIIDGVGEVLTLDPARLEAVPENLNPEWRAVSNGIYCLNDKLLVILDVDRLMNFERGVRAA